MLAPPLSLHVFRCRLCAQMLPPPHCTHLLHCRPCGHFFLTARAAAAGCASAGCCAVLLSSLAPRPDASLPMASPPSSSCKDCGGLAWWGLLLVDAGQLWHVSEEFAAAVVEYVLL